MGLGIFQKIHVCEQDLLCYPKKQGKNVSYKEEAISEHDSEMLHSNRRKLFYGKINLNLTLFWPIMGNAYSGLKRKGTLMLLSVHNSKA